jgi:hypothetical protein
MEPTRPIREKLDYSQVLFEMMMQAMRDCHEPPAFQNDINLIEGTLSPYGDEEHRKNMKEIRDSFRNRMNNEAMDYKDMREKPDTGMRIRMQENFAIYKELMRLARKKGLLPEEILRMVSLRERIE